MDNQLTIYDEVYKRNRPEPTRAERIAQLEEMGRQRREEAEFWFEHGNTLRATHFYQVAEGDFRLAAMLKR